MKFNRSQNFIRHLIKFIFLMNSEVRQLMSDVAYLREVYDKLSSDVEVNIRTVRNVLNTQINVPPYPSANILYNGDFSHSINSWQDSSYVANNRAYECIYWFSNDAPYNGQVLALNVNSPFDPNQSIKTTFNSYYDVSYGDWDSVNGIARMQGTKSLDSYLQSNVFDATTPLARCSLIAAKRNQYIEIPDDALMYAGIWDNTIGQNIFIFGTLGFTAEVNGTPAGTVEKRYKIAFVSDRGFTIVSPEITLANAPNDASFSPGINISFSWKQQAGQLEVQLYEYVPSLSRYRLIEVISASTSYIHNGTFLDAVAGYPTGTGTEGTSIFYTKEGEMTDLATDGISPAWNTINFPIAIASDYDKSNTTGSQWLRLGMTVPCNLFVTGITTNGTATIEAPAAVFEAAYDSLFDAGTLVAEIYDANDVLLSTTTVDSRTDATHIVLGASIAAGTNRKIRIVAGGFHGILVDKVHLGYHQNTAYSPNSDDARTLQPVAAPVSSSQGGVGDGGSGGGIYNCVVGKTPIKTANGDWVVIEKCVEGDEWASAEFAPNLLTKLKPGFDFVREVRTDNGLYIRCTDSERFVVDRNDHNGTPLARLRVGDEVLTEIDGKIESSRISSISKLLAKEVVYTPTLSNNRLFIGGEFRLSFWQKLKNLFKRRKKGGFVLHNRKINELYEFY